MTLNDTMQRCTTVYKTIQHYKAIRHHTTLYNVRYTRLYNNIYGYTTLYDTIQRYIIYHVEETTTFEGQHARIC